MGIKWLKNGVFYLNLLSQNFKGQNWVNFIEKLWKNGSFQLIDIIYTLIIFDNSKKIVQNDSAKNVHKL